MEYRPLVVSQIRNISWNDNVLEVEFKDGFISKYSANYAEYLSFMTYFDSCKVLLNFEDATIEAHEKSRSDNTLTNFED